VRKDLFRWLSAMTALGLLASTVVGCSPKGPAGGVAKAEELKSDRPRLEAPSVGEAQVPGLVDGNSEFALDLYRVLFASDKNLFYSPYSISLALAMTYAGAKGETEREMAEVLHFAMGQDSLHQAFNALDQALASRGQQVKEDDQRFRLHIANALWGQQGFAFLASFLDTLAGNYGAGMRLVDFQSSPENARHTINQWVEDQTEDKIKDVLPPGSIDALTRLVLSNAIYFNASWMHPFEKRATKDGAFHLLDGSTVTVPMMQQGERLGYADGANYQAVELPYVGGELSMVVLLPAEGTFGDFARQLDAAQLDAIFSDITQMRVNLTMPKFEYEAGFELKGALQRLGMKSAFDTAADFSGMTGRPELFISDVYHKAFVKVDEEGTEAAAATAVVMKLTAAPAVPVEIKVDRSFIFLIRDVETGAIVFLGHVVNPAA
jgi:serpin B